MVIFIKRDLLCLGLLTDFFTKLFTFVRGFKNVREHELSVIIVSSFYLQVFINGG